MRQYIYIIIAFCLTIAACSDEVKMPGNGESIPESVTFQYVTSTYTGSRAESTGYCWQENGWNENSINSLDLLLIKDDVIISYWNTVYDTPNSEDCGQANKHEFLTVRQDMPQLSTNMIAKSDHICLIANQPLSEESPVGKKASELLKEATAIEHDSKQQEFLMVGYIPTPQMGENAKSYNINIPLKRVAAKIRVTLANADKSIMPPESYAIMLCHYVTTSAIIPDNSVNDQLDRWEKELTGSIRITASTLSTVVCADNASWNIEEDLAASQCPVHNNGCVFYTYPTDWYNYDIYRIGRCTSTKHAAEYHANNTVTRLTVRDYNVSEPINPDRQVFAIVQAPFGEKKYYYKVPINYRFYKKNDAMCFSVDEVRNEILPLYRADRNHFYDVTAIIDRAGAGTPEEAATNPYFTATIAPMNDGGTFDYIYD